MKKDMPLEGLRWSRDSGSALYDTPQTAVLGRAGGGGVPSEIVDVALTETSPGSYLCCRSFYKDEGSMVFDSHRSCETHDEASNSLRFFDYCHWISIR